MKDKLVYIMVSVLLSAAQAGYAGGGGGHGGGGHSAGHGGAHGVHHDGDHGGHVAHHGAFHHGGLFIGIDHYFGPYWDPLFHGPAPVIVTQPAPPTVYIEKSEQRRPYYWYYCSAANGYYPYVKECPQGWMRVVPQAPPP